jgi:hypothetical protein
MKKIIIIICILFSFNAVAQPCLGTQTHSYSPTSSPTLPIGTFIPGQVITLTYTLQSFNGININWIHAFQIILGPGFTNLTPITTPGNPAGSTGNWIWDLQNTYPSGYNFGPGWRFVNTFDPDWGTSSTGPFTMRFQVTVGPTCTPDLLSISMEVLDDCTPGGWSNGPCCTDPPVLMLLGSVSVPPINTSLINHY